MWCSVYVQKHTLHRQSVLMNVQNRRYEFSLLWFCSCRHTLSLFVARSISFSWHEREVFFFLPSPLARFYLFTRILLYHTTLHSMEVCAYIPVHTHTRVYVYAWVWVDDGQTVKKKPRVREVRDVCTVLNLEKNAVYAVYRNVRSLPLFRCIPVPPCVDASRTHTHKYRT